MYIKNKETHKSTLQNNHELILYAIIEHLY